MTRDELLVRVKQLINKPVQTAADDTGRPSNSEILQNIEEARTEIYHEIMDLAGDRNAKSVSMTYVANAETMTLPSVAQDQQILYVYYQASSAVGAFQTALQPVRIAEFVNIGETGTPKYYVVTGKVLRLRPLPSSDSSLVLYYLPGVSTLSAATSEPDELPARWHHIYAYKAAMKLRQKNEDPLGGLEREYNDIRERLITNVALRANDNHIQQTDASNFWQG